MRAESRRPTPHLGALAHDRNRYKHKAPDFYALGQQYAEFRHYLRNVDDVNCRASLAWDDPFAVRELTKTLLLHDFGLHWEIPINRLCPPLPNRLNYLHWIEDLLRQADWSKFVGQEQDLKTTAVNEEIVSGIDVGTGANCIYALLGATMNKWRFIATEIDAESFACAKENVSRNHLEAFITVKRTHTNRLLAEPLEGEPLGHKFHFVMCNPPFFDNMDEADTNPESSCMGSTNEMVFPGGEVAFIGRMIADSKDLQNRVLWFTSMVGRKASLRKLLALLRETKVRSTRTTEFFQGRTKRWGIAWTFAEDVADTLSVKVLGKRKEAHRKQELRFRLPLKSEEAAHGCTSVAEVHMRIREFVDSADGLQLLTESKGQTNQGTEHEECRDRRRFRLEQHKPNQETPDDGLTQVHCAGRVDVLSLNDNEGGFEVFIAFEEGKRAAFWTIVDMLQAATIRTGRQWRRALRQQQYHQ
uniref:U6 small nuclear RNA (adenine-(43)-N(6))-methyltransferase n=1 Tax=Peronospora matthiolae TaxID=2874970 RepID=A0AAV1TYH4_9STRA